MRSLTAVVATAALTGLVATPAAAAGAQRDERTYIAIGDSVTGIVEPKSFSDRLYRSLRRPESGGANRMVKVFSLRASNMVEPNGGLVEAKRLIRKRSNVVAVTLTIGGNDALGGACYSGPSCVFPAQLDTILRRLNAALRRDPGRERVALLAYYNPWSGKGAAESPPYPTEDQADRILLGADLRIDCARAGPDAGLNDVISCTGLRRDWAVVDAWPAFKAGGPRLMFDSVHPSDAGQRVLTRLFRAALGLRR